jgi:aryl-alcohol dehydrogenase-like predicted oxidoreductase
VATFRDAAKKHGISGHEAVLRWTAYHDVLDEQYGDGVIFGVSNIGHVEQSLDSLEAGPPPAELADAITAIYATVEGPEPPYHL